MNEIERLKRENARLQFILDDVRRDMQDIIDIESGVKFGLFGNAPRVITRMLTHAMRARMMIDNYKAEDDQ